MRMYGATLTASRPELDLTRTFCYTIAAPRLVGKRSVLSSRIQIGVCRVRPESRVPSDVCCVASGPFTHPKSVSYRWQALYSSRHLRPRFVFSATLIALILGLTAAQVESLLTNDTTVLPEVRAQNGSAGCNWSCCGPMALFIHAAGHSIVDPDPSNEPNQIDLVWRRADVNEPKANIVVPIRFRLKYCEGWGGSYCHYYEGYIKITKNAPPVVMVDTLKGEPWPSVGVCGQSLPAPFPSATQIVSLAPWVSPNPVNPGSTNCGSNASLDELACESFVDTDYTLWIARTAMQSPNEPQLCFNSMEVWVDGPQADDDNLLIQHDDDAGNPTCFNEESDAYTLASTPRWTITRSQFTTYPSQRPRECLQADPSNNDVGGQEYTLCIFANFTPME